MPMCFIVVPFGTLGHLTGQLLAGFVCGHVSLERRVGWRPNYLDLSFWCLQENQPRKIFHKECTGALAEAAVSTFVREMAIAMAASSAFSVIVEGL